MSDKVALVTDASNDIGKAIVETLTECGANVGMMDQNIEELIKVETAINAKSGGSVFAIKGDIFNPGDLEIAVWQTVEVFGTVHIAVILVEESVIYVPRV